MTETENTSVTRARAEADLWSVFRDQEAETELLLYRTCMIFGLAAFLLPSLSLFVLGRTWETLWPFFIICVVFAGAFTAAYFLRKRDWRPGLLRFCTVILFAVGPWAVMAAYAHIHGMERALGTWEAIMIFAACCVLSILWRRPYIPVLLATLGAVCYVTLWYTQVPPATWGTLPSSSPLRPGVTIYRTALLILVGVLCWRGALFYQRTLLAGARALRARDLFGKYRLQEDIGQGGMGSVVKALYCPEGGFERPVAIKRVRADLASSPDTVAQFRAEAELGSRLVHPNIVAVLDFGRVDDTYFFAMEYVDGPSLASVLHQARVASIALPTAFVARVGCDVCAALQFAHAEALGAEGTPLHVVHRDLSPPNILVARSGQVKITDFGIARVLGDADSEQTTRVVGKVAYMSPEVVQARAFDARSDLYAFGVVIWEMLTGERLFRRSNPAASALAAAEAVVPKPSSIRESLDPAWDEICAKAMARDPDDRYQTAAELGAALLERLSVEGDAESDEVRLVLQLLEDLEYDENAEMTDRSPELSWGQSGESVSETF